MGRVPGAGRKRLHIDWEAVADMLKKDVSVTTIAARMGLGCTDTLYVRCKKDLKLDFSAFRQQKLAEGADELKELAFDKAKEDKTMHIFLLKNRAGYADRTITDNTHHLPEETAKAVEALVGSTAQAKKELEDEDEEE